MNNMNNMAIEVIPGIEETKSLRPRKLTKEINGKILTIKEVTTGTTAIYDFASLPVSIQENLGPYGLSQKLGDAAAGKSGKEAVDAIDAVWQGLCAGNWSVKAPAGEKVSKNDIAEKIKAMPEGKQKQQAIAMAQQFNLLPANFEF